MQRAAPAINSNYQQVTRAAADGLDDQYKQVDQQVKTLPLQPNQPGFQRHPLVQQRRQLGEQIQAHLRQNMTTIQNNFRQHQANMQQLAQSAKAFITTAKNAADNAARSNDAVAYSTAAQVTAHMGAELDHVIDAAEADSKAFFASWNEYRQLNMTHTDDEFKREFNEARNDLMADLKQVTALLNKLRQLRLRADAFHQLSVQLLNRGKTMQSDKTANVAAAKKLMVDLDKLMDNTMSQSSKIGLHSLESKANTLHANAAKPKIEKALAKTMESFVSDLTATAKTYKTTVKTMTTLYNTLMKGLDDADRKDKQIAASLTAATKLLQEANAGLAKANAAVVQANKDILVIRQKAPR